MNKFHAALLGGVVAAGMTGAPKQAEAHVGGISLYNKLGGEPTFILAQDLSTSLEAKEKTVAACTKIIGGSAEIQFYYRKLIKKAGGIEGFCDSRYNERVNAQTYLSLGSGVGKKPNPVMTGFGATSSEATADMDKKCPACDSELTIKLLSCVETPDYLETQKADTGLRFFQQTAEKSCKENPPTPNVTIYNYNGKGMTATRLEDYTFPAPVKLTSEIIKELTAKGGED